MQKNRLLRDVAILTGSSLFMRGIALIFQMWLVSRLGAAGVGLYGLVGSVGMLAATFAISGIRFAATRLISEELGLKREGGVGSAMGYCIAYALFFGISGALILYLTAEPIGFLWVGDARTVLPLRILSLCLPFIAISSVFYGYFVAVGRIYKAAFIQVTEQLVRICLVAVFLGLAPIGDLEKSCAAVTAGSVCAEVCSFILMIITFLLDRKKYGKKREASPRLPVRMMNIAIPLAFSAYARASLSTLEHLLVPRGLKLAGFSANAALAGYGTIQGMVFPIIFFPSCIVCALAELVVPELTAAQVAGKYDDIRRMVNKLLKKNLVFSLTVGALLFLLAEFLSQTIYKSDEAGRYIRIFAGLAPIMYMDIVTDGCLKGLGQQVWSMGFNIMDALFGVVLVYTLLPRYALDGYIVIIFFEEIFNFTLSSLRLRKVLSHKGQQTAPK